MQFGEMTRHDRNRDAPLTHVRLCQEPLRQYIGNPRAFTAKNEAYAIVKASPVTASGIAAVYAHLSKPLFPWRYFL